MSHRYTFYFVVFLTLVGFALRLHRLGDVPFRGDEAFTIQNWVQLPLSDTLQNIATVDPHPPLAYALFRGWGLVVGVNEFTMRLLPALLNILGIPALYALGHRLGGRQLGLIAALIWTFHPLQVWHAQDARNYAIWAGFSAVAVWLALRALAKQHRIDWILYLIAGTIAAYVYYLELFTLVVLNLYVLIAYWRNWRVWRWWIGVQAGIGFLLALWFVQPRLLTGGGYGGTTTGFDPLLLVNRFLPELNFGPTLPIETIAWLWPVLFIIVSISIGILTYKKRQIALLLGLWIVVPLLLLSIVSLRLNVFTPRYVMASAPAYVLLFGSALITVAGYTNRKKTRNRIIVVGIAGWLIMSGYSLNNYFTNPTFAKSQNWPALTDYLAANVTDNDLVIQTAVDAAFGYYYNATADDIGLPANPQQPISEVIATLEDSSNTYDSLWIVGRTFSDWPNAGQVEAWAENNMQRVRSTIIDGLPAQQFMRWDVRVDEVEDMPMITFGDVVELVGVQIFAPEPSGELTIWLYWRPIQTSEMALKVFVHLVGDINPETGTPLWAQDDRFPQNGRISTDSWVEGSLYRDVYVLPISNVPAGEYQLIVGLYDPATNERLSTDDGDSYRIGEITLP